MKKRYFVLRGDSPGSPARLEYYASEKKFKDGKSQPRKAVELRSCLGIGATASARVSFAIAVHTRDDWLAVGFDSESDRDDWLAAARRLLGVGGGKCGGDVGAPMFEHVWIINLRPKGLGRGLAGLYRLCLTDRTLSLVKRASSEANLTFPLEVMRRCGHTDNFFFVEVGRQASTGEGELWMEAEDALIAQSAHYAVQRAMHATKDGVTISSSSPITASTSAALPAGSTAAAAATKALDGGSADHRQGSESSTGGEAAAMRRPEADLSPSQPSRFSTATISLLTRRLSSKSKPASGIVVPASGGTAPASGSIVANGSVSASTNGHDWSAPAADAIEREARLLSISKLDRPVALGAAAIRRNSSSSSSHCRAGCRDASSGELAARGGSPVPVIEITAVSKESDDPYFEMSVHDLSAGAGHTAGTDYMDMTPRSAASSTETALAPIFVPVDDNYLAMLPGRGIGAIGSMHSSPATAAAASAPDNLPTPDASLLFGPVTPACQQRSPRCHSRDGGSCGRMAPKGSQQLLLPDLFSLMPGPVVGSGGTGSPTSTNFDGASAARSSASLGVPNTHWSDGGDGSSSRGTGDSLGSTAGARLRAGSDAPTHRGKAAKQRSGEPAPPDQRQRSSSQGCVPASLGAFGQSILRPAVARGLSDESAASSAEAESNRAVGVSLPGSYEYVAIDFAEPARTGAEPAVAATAGSGATIAAAHEQHSPRPAATAAVTLAGRQHLPPSIAVAASASSHGWPELGDYIGIDFGKASAQASGGSGTGCSGSPWPAKMLPAAGAAAAADDLMSEPFPELAAIAVPKPHGNTSQQRVVTGAVAAGAASAVSASQAAHARSSSLPSAADGLHHAAGSSHLEPAAAAAPVVGGSLLLLTPAPKFGLDHRPNAAHGEAYVMFSRASARCSATNDRSEAPERSTIEVPRQQQHGDAYAELDPPTGRGSRLEALPPSQGCGTVLVAASTADCTSGDSYAVMNFSSDAVQQLALSPLPPQPSTAKVASSATLASTGEQPDLGGELAHCDEGGWRGAQSPSRPSPSAGAAATAAFSSAVSMGGGGGGGSLRQLPAFGGSEAMQPASSTNRLAMPVRATCYIKDDDEDDGRDVRSGCSSRRAAAIDQMFTGNAVQRSQKSGASRAAAAAARPRPSSVSYPVCAEPPPPLPARSAPPTAASAAGSKPRHSSGSKGGELPLVTAINYASLDLDAEPPPRTSAAAVAVRPLARPSSGGSLLPLSSSSSSSCSDSGGARSVSAGSGVQYSRIDFAKVEALKAGKT